MNRNDIIAWILVKEGGLCNVSGDPGGLTNFGITQHYLDAVRPKFADLTLPASVADLTPVLAMELYRRNEWADIKGDSLPAGLALLVMDAAVNYGPLMAVVLLQQALRIPVDGKVGPVTLAAIQRVGAPLLAEYAARRAVYYAQDDSRGDKFELGWMRRLIACYTKAISP